MFGWYTPAQNRYMQEKHSWGINFCANTCGACIRMSANAGKYFWGIIFEICIRTLPPALCNDIAPVFAHPWCKYIKIFFGELISVQIHAATCIHTWANTGKYFWRIIYVLVSCQGVSRTVRGTGATWRFSCHRKRPSSCYGTLNSWARGSAERIWGEFYILAWPIFGTLPANASANCDGEVCPRILRPCFFQGFSPPPQKKRSRPKFTPRIVGIPISLSRTLFLNADFLLGETTKSRCSAIGSPYLGVCALVLQKHVLCVPILHRWQGSWGKQIQEFVRMGHTLRLLDEVQEPGISSTRKPETQDSQHMLNQPRGFFPDLQALHSLYGGLFHCLNCRFPLLGWDHSFPLENSKITIWTTPGPSWKLPKNYLKMTKSVIFYWYFCGFKLIFSNFQDGFGVGQIVIFE